MRRAKAEVLPTVVQPSRGGSAGRLRTTRATRILSVDDVAAKILQRDGKVLNDKPLAVLVEVGDRQEFRSRLALMPEGGVVRDWELRFRAPDGKPIRVVATVEASQGDDAANGLQWSIVSLPEPPRSESSPSESRSSVALEDVLSQLAHELNQPLAAIISYARGCVLRSRNGQLKQADLESILESIAAEAHRAAALLRTTSRAPKMKS